MRLLHGCYISCLALLLQNGAASAGCTIPFFLTNGQAADADQVMGNFNSLSSCINSLAGGTANSIQYNSGAGALAGMTPLLDGQIPIGVSGGAPQAGSITAGPGIAITTGPGSITISNTAIASIYTPPRIANFTLDHAIQGASAQDSSTGLMIYEPYQPSDNNYIWWLNSAYAAPTTTSTIGVRATFFNRNYAAASLYLGDSTSKLVRYYISSNSSGAVTLSVDYWNNYSTYNRSTVTVYIIPGGDIFLQVVDDGSNFNFKYGKDLNSLVSIGTLSRTEFLTSGPTKIGIGLNNLTASGPALDAAATFYHSNFGN